MKKILFLFAFLSIALTTFSQVRFGVKAGLNLANQKISGSGIDLSTKNTVGFNIGGVVEIPIASSFFFQPGVSFSTKGFKYEETLLGTTTTLKSSLNYLDIPLNLMYKIRATENLGVLVLAGPNLGLGLSGKYDDGTEKTDVKFGSAEDDDLKALDFGLNFGAGVEFGKFQITAQYGLGLSNLSTQTDASAKNNVLSFNVAYFF